MRSEPDTRTRLLEAAIAVIETRGEPAIRIREISETAGVSYASLYHFFGDRASLIEEAQVERFRVSLYSFIPELAVAVEGCRTKREFRKLAKSALERLFAPDRAEHRWRRANVLGAAETRPTLAVRLEKALDEYYTALADALAPAQAKGWVRRDLDLKVFSTWMLGMVSGRLLIELSPEPGLDNAWDDIAVEAVLAVLIA